jgi:O-antigen/teichoic acid export membrane protein
MSIKRNILANYISQIYTAVIGIVMVPVYVRFMGPEAYGLVGFYALLQGWFQLLDIGLTPTMMREIARFRGGAIGTKELRQLIRVLEVVFIGIALIGASLVAISSPMIATKWLRIQQLTPIEVQQSIMLMGCILAVRWISGLYRGAINGFEQLVWLGGFNVVFASFKSFFVIWIFIAIGKTPVIYFSFQLLVSFIEMTVLVGRTYQQLPQVEAGETLAWEWSSLTGIIRFSLSIAFTGSVWVLVTQTGNLVLSKLLSLKEFGYFTMAVVAANGVMLITGPISGAVLPRLTKLCAEGDEAGFIGLYKQATQLMAIFAIPVSLMLSFFASRALWVWTGNPEISTQAAPILALYAIGNGVLCLSAFPYYLQYAKGDLKLHLVGSAIFFIVYIPLLIWATIRFGAIGAGYSWVTVNLLYLFFWLPKVHSKFVKGLNSQWFRDIGTIFLPTLVIIAISFRFIPWFSAMRFHQAVNIVLIGIASMFFAILGSEWVRLKLLRGLRASFQKT